MNKAHKKGLLHKLKYCSDIYMEKKNELCQLCFIDFIKIYTKWLK